MPQFSSVPITPERWAQVVAAYRKYGRSHLSVAKEIKCDYRTARKYYEQGAGAEFPPIKSLIEVLDAKNAPVAPEGSTPHPPAKPAPHRVTDYAPPSPAAGQAAERILSLVPSEPVDPESVREASERAVMEIRQEFAQALRREGQMVRIIREATVGGVGMTTKLMVGMDAVCDRLKVRLMRMAEEDVKTEGREGLGRTVQLLGYLDRLAKIHIQFVGAAKTSLEMSRQLVGLPQVIREERVTVQGDNSEERERALAEAMDTLKQLKAKREHLSKELPDIIDVEPEPYEGEEGGDA